MADYYPVLARAVSRLSENNAGTRHELYERARGIVLEELRKRDPEKLAPEQAALEAAFSGWRRKPRPSKLRCAQRRLRRKLQRAPPGSAASAPSRTAVNTAAPAKTAPRYLSGFRTRRPSKPA